MIWHTRLKSNKTHQTLIWSLLSLPLSCTPIHNKTTKKKKKRLNETFLYLGLRLGLDFLTPPKKEKKRDFGHNIFKLKFCCLSLLPIFVRL